MKTLGETAKAYEQPQTKNIADLEIVSTDLVLEERIGKDKEGKEFSYSVVLVDGVDYRVPDSVLFQLKAVLIKKPTLKHFNVSKTGQGMNTRYTVIPLE